MPSNNQYEVMAAQFEREQAAARASTFKELVESGELSGADIDEYMYTDGVSEEELGNLAEARYKEAKKRAEAQSEIERKAEFRLSQEIQADTLAQEAQDIDFDRKARPHVYVDEKFKSTYDQIQEGYKQLGLDPVLAKDVEAVGDIDLRQFGVQGTTTKPLMVKESMGGRTRIGTEVRNIDGMNIVVPSQDPVTGKALTLFEGSKAQGAASTFGQDLSKIDHASEYTQRQLARRMGREFKMNNRSGVTNTDFTEGTRLIDGQVQKDASTTQLFTQVDPIETPIETKYSQVTNLDMDERSRTVQNRVFDAIDQNPDKSIYEVITGLSDPSNPDRTLKGGWTRENPEGGIAFNGKAYSNRPEQGRPPKHPKDEIFYTKYDSDVAETNYKSHDIYSTAPKGVEIEDVDKAAEWVDNLRGDDLKSRLSIHKNGRGRVRRDGSTTYQPKSFAELRLKPGDTNAFRTSTEEIVRRKPATAQFLDYDGTSPKVSGVRQDKPQFGRTPTPVTRQVAQRPPAGTPVRRRSVPKGEGGFVITPGARATAVARVKPRLKGPSTVTKITKAAPIADIAIEGGLSYLTGETDRLDHAAWKGVTSLIPDAGAAGGNTIDIGGKLYSHDKSTNMITPMGGGKTRGLAYKDGKPVAVDYGSLEGRTSMVSDVVTPIVETGKAIKETAIRRAQEWTKPKPSNERVMAVLNGKEGYMMKGDSSSFRMANWNEAQRSKYYGK